MGGNPSALERKGLLMKLVRMVKSLVRDESGAVATEYVVLTGLVAISLVAVVLAFGDQLRELFNQFLVEIGAAGGEGATETDLNKAKGIK
jgi:Flp pilus assembly pilin Flp